MSTEPWYKKAAQIHSASEREEFYRGVFGFSKPKHDPLTVAAFTLGAASFLRNQPRIIPNSTAFNEGSFLSEMTSKSIESPKDKKEGFIPSILRGWFKARDLKGMLTLSWPELEAWHMEKAKLISELETLQNGENAQELFQILPKAYKLNLTKLIGYQSAVNAKWLILNERVTWIKSRFFWSSSVEYALEVIEDDLKFISNQYEICQKVLDEAENIKRKWLEENEHTDGAKRAKELLKVLWDPNY